MHSQPDLDKNVTGRQFILHKYMYINTYIYIYIYLHTHTNIYTSIFLIPLITCKLQWCIKQDCVAM
jgi:hypothetical protein